MAFPGDPTSITIDGKKFKLGELKDEIETIRSMFMFDRKELDTKTVYAFRNEKSLKSWAKDNSLDQWYKQLRSGKRPAKGSYTPEQEAELKKALKTEVDWQTKRFATTLAQNGIESSDSDAIIRLIENPDPRRGPILGSATIWEHDDHRGHYRYLPNYRVYCSLASIGYDRRISSLINYGGTIRLYNLLNGSLSCPDPDDLTNFNHDFRELVFSGSRRIFKLSPFGFNDVARSAETV